MATSTEVSFGLKILISKILQTLVKVDSIWLISYFRSIIVFASVVSGGFFLHDNTSEFLKSTVQTTLDSMVPLTQVSTKFWCQKRSRQVIGSDMILHWYELAVLCKESEVQERTNGWVVCDMCWIVQLLSSISNSSFFFFLFVLLMSSHSWSLG